MYYIINLETFIVVRGPFIEYRQAANAKNAIALKIDKTILAIVKVVDNDW